MIDPAVERAGLLTAAEELYQKTQKAIEEIGDPKSIPPLMVMVLDKIVPREGRTDFRDYIGVIIEPENRWNQIQDVLRTFPTFRGYAVIMHANMWEMEKDPLKGRSKTDLNEEEIIEITAEARKSAIHHDALILILATPDSVETVKSMTYKRTASGALVWEDRNFPVSTEDFHPMYQQVFLSEEDFE